MILPVTAQSLSWRLPFLEGKVFFWGFSFYCLSCSSQKKMKGSPVLLAEGTFYRTNSFYRWLPSLLLTSWTLAHCAYWQRVIFPNPNLDHVTLSSPSMLQCCLPPLLSPPVAYRTQPGSFRTLCASELGPSVLVSTFLPLVSLWPYRVESKDWPASFSFCLYISVSHTCTQTVRAPPPNPVLQHHLSLLYLLLCIVSNLFLLSPLLTCKVLAGSPVGRCPWLLSTSQGTELSRCLIDVRWMNGAKSIARFERITDRSVNMISKNEGETVGSFLPFFFKLSPHVYSSPSSRHPFINRTFWRPGTTHQVDCPVRTLSLELLLLTLEKYIYLQC